MRTTWGKAALAATALTLLLSATAQAASPNYTWTFSGGQFSVEQNTKVTMLVTNFSAETISVLVDADLDSTTKTLTPGGQAGVVTPVCGLPACDVHLIVLATSPDLFVNATFTLDGNTQQTYLGPGEFEPLGPQGTTAGMLAQVNSSVGLLSGIGATVTSLQTTLGGVGGQVATLQTATGGIAGQVSSVAGALGGVATATAASSLGSQVHTLTKRVDTLTHDLTKLSHALVPTHKSKKHSASHR
jgi:hypothetical protein